MSSDPAPSILSSKSGTTASARRASVIARSRWLLRSPAALAGAVMVCFWIAVALLAPWIVHYDPNFSDVSALAAPTPSARHWLGTDQLGRDLLSRIVWGARTVLVVAPFAVFCAYFVGNAVGLAAGYLGGVVDAVIMRATDVVMSFPVLIIYIVLITAIGPSRTNIVLAVVLGSAPSIARLVRSQALEIKTEAYIAAAQLRGESAIQIALREMLPNMRKVLVADACMRLGFTIVAIGTLGFLGMGLPPPEPDWGSMVKDASKLLTIWPHMALLPCLALSSLVVGFSLIADGLSSTTSVH